MRSQEYALVPVRILVIHHGSYFLREGTKEAHFIHVVEQ